MNLRIGAAALVAYVSAVSCSTSSDHSIRANSPTTSVPGDTATSTVPVSSDKEEPAAMTDAEIGVGLDFVGPLARALGGADKRLEWEVTLRDAWQRENAACKQSSGFTYRFAPEDAIAAAADIRQEATGTNLQPVGDGTFSYGLDLEILERVNSPEPEGPAPAAEFLSPEYQSALEACGSRKTLTAKYQNYLAMVSDRDQLVGSIFQDEVMTSAANAWSRCVNSAGLVAETPSQLSNETALLVSETVKEDGDQWLQMVDYERKVAAKDAECRRSSGYARALIETTTRIEQEYVDTHEELLRQVRDELG